MDIIDELPSLKQKFVVDLVNGIDINRHYIRVQKNDSGLFARMWNSYTGESHNRQNKIDQNIAEGLNACLSWLNNITEQVTLANNTLVKVNDGLNKIKLDLARVANFAADTHDQLVGLQRKVDKRCIELEARIQEVDLRQRAYQQMDSLLVSWSAGNYSSLSLGQKCFLVLSELGWGVFGDYCKTACKADRAQILRTLRDRLVSQVNQDVRLSPGSRQICSVWLQADVQPSDLGLEYLHAVRYLGSRVCSCEQPFAHFVLHPNVDHPSRVPYLMDSSRLIKGIENDLIRDGVFYVN